MIDNDTKRYLLHLKMKLPHISNNYTWENENNIQQRTLLPKYRKNKFHYQIAKRNGVYMEETNDEICYLNNSNKLLQLIGKIPDQDHEVYTASKV